MRRVGPFAIVTIAALAGALTTLLVARGAGMRGGELIHLGQLLLPAMAATIVTAGLAEPLLRKATVATRFVALALIAVVVSLANLGVLAALMLVKHDALLIAALIGYSGAAGLGAALALSRSFRSGVARLVAGADSLSHGDLGSRIGKIEGSPELDRLAATLDDMGQRLEATIEAEQKAIGVRDDLITAVSHDLRTPLAGLRAMIEAIDDGVVDDNDTFRRYAAEMKLSVAALVVLVDDLFELIQLDAGAIRAETDRATIDEVVGSVLAACGGQAVEKGVNLETSIGTVQGELVSPRLTRALQNLVQNAIRHTPGDGTVRIFGQRDQTSIEVAVEDSGEGIPEASLERVFEPFWRGDSSRTERGAGLGLAVAKRIVEAIGGTVIVRSTLGEGSRFSVFVPATPAE